MSTADKKTVVAPPPPLYPEFGCEFPKTTDATHEMRMDFIWPRIAARLYYTITRRSMHSIALTRRGNKTYPRSVYFYKWLGNSHKHSMAAHDLARRAFKFVHAIRLEKKLISAEALVIAYIYFRRYMACHFVRDDASVGLVFGGCMTLASKYHDDSDYYICDEVALRLECTLRNVSDMEDAICSALHFNLAVTPEEFKLVYEHIAGPTFQRCTYPGLQALTEYK